jgi:hypothetical protein
MEQEATYWAPAGHDGFGGRTFSAPVVIRCRWQDTNVLFLDAQRREVVSEAVVYPDRKLDLGGKLALGEFIDPEPVDEAKEVRQRQSSPDLSAVEELHKVFL